VECPISFRRGLRGRRANAAKQQIDGLLGRMRQLVVCDG